MSVGRNITHMASTTFYSLTLRLGGGEGGGADVTIAGQQSQCSETDGAAYRLAHQERCERSVFELRRRLSDRRDPPPHRRRLRKGFGDGLLCRNPFRKDYQSRQERSHWHGSSGKSLGHGGFQGHSTHSRGYR